MPLWKVLSLLFGVNLLLRISTLFQPVVNIDEPQYAQMVWEWMAGDPPYTTAFGDKPFFIYLFYYVFLSLFGKFNLIAVHAGIIGVAAFTALAVFWILKENLDEKRALTGAVLFSCLTTMGDLRLVSADGETMMNLPMCLGMLFFLRALETRRLFHFLLTGLCIGLAAQFRYQAGIQLAVVGSVFCLYEPFFVMPKGERLRAFWRSLWPLGVMVAVFLLCFALVFLWLWWRGSWEAYRFWSWEFEFDYIRVGSQTIPAWKNGLIRTSLTILGGLALWWAAAGTLLRARKDRNFLSDPKARRLFVVALLWLVWGYVAVTVGGRFSPRYFTQIFPPVALLAAMTFRFHPLWRRCLLLIPLIGFWIARFFAPEVYAMAGVYDYTRWQKEIGHYIQKRTRPEDRIFIWGWGQAIYIHAERRHATRFMNTDYVTGRIPGSPTAYDLNFDTSFNIVPSSWEMLMEDLEKSKPPYVLDTSPANLHDYIKYPIKDFPRLQKYLEEHYTLETVLYGIRLYRRR